MADVPLPTDPVANTVNVANQPLDASASPIDIEFTDQQSDSTAQAGSGGAAMLQLGDIRSKVDIGYDVNVEGVLRLEVSNDQQTWFPFADIDTSSSQVPLSDVVQVDTAFDYIRFYPDGADYADGDVTSIVLVAKGVS